MSRPIDRFLRPRYENMDETIAWLLSEGDQLASGAVILSVYRDVTADKVRVATTTQPGGVELGRDEPVRVSRRATT